MRKYLFLLVALVCANSLRAQSQTQYQVVQCNSGTTCAIPVTSTGAGHAIFLGIDYTNNSSQDCNLTTDNQGNTWVKATGQVNVGTHESMCQQYVCNPTSGVTTVTGNFPTAGFATMFFYEYSGISSTSCLDVGNTAAGQSSPFASANATTTTATELLIGLATGQTAFAQTFTGTSTGGVSWTVSGGQGTGTGVNGNSYAGAGLVAVASSTGTYFLSFSSSGGSLS